MKKYALSFLAAALLCTSSFGAEADYFTARTAPEIQDVAQILNAKANAYIDQALGSLNAKSICDNSAQSEKALYSELERYFANHSKGKIIKWILSSEDFPKIVTPMENSIYRNWSWKEGYFLATRNKALRRLTISPIIRVGDSLTGVDKLEHMFGMGLRYFKAHYLKKKELTDVLETGIFKEKTVLGGNALATGVFSYGDLAANFNGMRFWNHVLQKRDDVLGKQYNLGPYVSCQAGKWTRSRNPDFRDYVDASMDESINCSKFATESGLEKFEQSIRALNSGCPVHPAMLQEMISKYNVPTPKNREGQTLEHWILNKEGPGVVSYFDEF